MNQTKAVEAQLLVIRSELLAELAKVNQAIAALRGEFTPLQPESVASISAPTSADSANVDHIPVPPKAGRTRRSRGDLQESSVALLRYIGMRGETYLGDAQTYVEKSGPVNPGSFRTQMHGYVTKGWLFRPKKGHYVLTPKGAKKIGWTLNEQNTPTGELDLPVEGLQSDPYNNPRH